MAGDGTSALDAALFFVLGLGSLFPWNAFITESSYFEERLRGSSFEHTFESAFGITYNGSNLVALLGLIFVQQFLAERTLIVLPYLCTAVIFCAMAFLTLVQVPSPEFLFYLTLIFVFLAGLLAAPMIAGLTGFSSRVSKLCASSMFSGQAFGGAVASLSSLLTTLSSGMKEDFCEVEVFDAKSSLGASYKKDLGAFWYFVFASIICFLCIASYATVKSRHPGDEAASLTHFQEPLLSLATDGASIGTFEESSLVEGSTGGIHTMEGSNTATSTASEAARIADGLNVDERTLLELNALPHYEAWDVSTVLRVSRIIKYPCLAVFATFWITLTVFPSVTASTESTKRCLPGTSRFHNDLFVPTLFLLFNLFDFIARIVQAQAQPFNGKQLFYLSLGRLLLLPCFWFQRVKDTRLPVLFDGDFFPIACSILCGFTNGYVGTSSMVYASRLVPAAHKNLASTISVTALTLGLMFGSATSFLSVWLIKG